MHRADPALQQRLDQSCNLLQHAFRLLRVRLNQAVLQVTVQAAQRVAILRSHVSPQRKAQFAQDLHRLVTALPRARMSPARCAVKRFPHRLNGAFVQHPGKLHRRCRRHAARNVFLVRLARCHGYFRPLTYRSTLGVFQTIFHPHLRVDSPTPQRRNDASRLKSSL